MDNVIFLKPYFVPKIWGGNELKAFNYTLPSNSIGEAWIVSGVADKASCLINGDYPQQTLDDFYTKHREWFGNYPTKVYPLLVKLLDCNDKLSVQVHPTPTYHKSHPQALVKNEAWYFLKAKANASIIYGHRAKTHKQLVQMVANQQWQQLLVKRNVKTNQIVYVPSGTVHALGKGLVVYEIQQASDTTYRLYDYGRDRKIDVQESLANITVPFKPIKLSSRSGELLSTPYFVLDKIMNVKKTKYEYYQCQWIQCTVIAGKGMIDIFPIKKGDTFLVGNGVKSFELTGKLTILVSYCQTK